VRVGRAKKEGHDVGMEVAAKGTVLSANGVEKNVMVVQKKEDGEESPVETYCRSTPRCSGHINCFRGIHAVGTSP
jgi:protein tyrosine phosphatase (PTP) superfamily phosphohydrolase (DUF442 family)